MWNKMQIKNHAETTRKLELIKDEVFSFIRDKSKKLYEKDVINFIKQSYKKHKLVNDSKKEFCIIAFGRNTSHVHYFTSTMGQKLKTSSLILLDIWARLDKKEAPYADMTWMFYFGKKIPLEIIHKWKILAKSRDGAINFIQNKLNKGKIPTGKEIDDVAHGILGKAGFGENIKHTIGHSLGFGHPHGDLPGINWKQYSPILKNIGYTIEPGMYCKNQFGLRTEIDFFINNHNKVVVTTPIQKEIILIDTK